LRGWRWGAVAFGLTVALGGNVAAEQTLAQGAAQERPGAAGPGSVGVDRPARPDNAATGSVTAGDAVRPMGNEPVPLTRVPTRDDERVLAKLHRLGQLEAAAGRLAAEKGSTKAVRDYGAQLVRDQQIVGQGLAQHATRLALDLGSAAPENAAEAAEERTHRRGIENLRKLSGREFDHAFAREMQSTHLEMLTLVTDARDRLDDRGLQVWLGELLPTIRRHEQAATNLIAATADRPPIID
jgi:predicted outer membrane protein